MSRRPQAAQHLPPTLPIYLVRHGEAYAEGDDRERGLTDGGQREVEAIARWAARAEVRPTQIRHSGKRRAEQTASILAEHLSPEEGVVAAAGLGPNDDVRAIAAAIEKEERTLMLVGHLPFLSRLASLLLVGDADQELVRFQPGGMVCLVREGEDWGLAWLMTPELAGRLD